MGKIIKLKNENYIDSSSISNNKKILSTALKTNIVKAGQNSNVFTVQVDNNQDRGYNTCLFFGGWDQQFLGIVVFFRNVIVGHSFIFNNIPNIKIENISCQNISSNISELTFTFNMTIWGGINILGTNI